MIRFFVSIMILSLSILLLAMYMNLLADAAQESSQNPDFVMINPIRQMGDSVYEDVLSYSDESFGNSDGRPTNVHETTHMIQSRERNKHFKIIGRCNAFYCLKGRVVVLREPRLTMRDIEIPMAARSYRHKLYFEKQIAYWNETPTYPLDEWSAYIIGAECALEDHESGATKANSDAVSGCLEFSIYSLATAMSIKEKDPDYWAQEDNFKKLLRFNLERAEKAFFSGREIFRFQGQEKLLKDFRNHDECMRIRKFMIEEFGEFFLSDR